MIIYSRYNYIRVNHSLTCQKDCGGLRKFMNENSTFHIFRGFCRLTAIKVKEFEDISRIRNRC